LKPQIPTISIEEAPISLSVLDSKLRFISCSPDWSREFGISDIDIVGKSFLDVVPHSPVDLRLALEKSCENTKKLVADHKHLLEDGSVRWYKWTIKPWKEKDKNYSGLIITCYNITETKRDKDLLVAAENVARMGGWDLDMVTNTVHWSQITKEIHGVPPDYIPTLETGVKFYKEGEHRDNITNLIRNAITYGQPWDTELQIVTAKGNELWVRAKGVPELINGKCVRLYGVFQDIDKKKKTEIKNAKIKERLDLATAVAQIGIWELDLTSNTLEWNNEMYHIYGLKRENFKGLYDAWKACLHPDDQERFQQEVEMALAGIKEFITEFRIIQPGGDIKHLKANAGVFRNEEGEMIKMIGTNWDITEQVNTQLKLDKSKASFKGSFESSAVGMALMATDGSWIDINDSLCISLGYTRKELLNLSFQDITHPADLNKELDHLQILLDGNGDSYQMEKRYFHKEGRIVHVVLTVTAVKDFEGNISHFISQIMDISSRIQANNKSEELLDITKNQNNSLLNFAHIVSHNLRSHSSNLTMLSNYLIQEEEENERKVIEKMIKEASESLSETVAHLNEVVQINTGAIDQLKEVNLNSTIRTVEKNITALLHEKNVECDITIDPTFNVKAVPAYLDSIFLNLFTNSIKYSSPERRPKITITSKKKGRSIVLDFKDNGLGINLERHGEKLFGMYKTFHEHEESRGIGLFITKNQIEAMDGKIEVESAVDKGTTFRVTLVSE